MATAMTNHENLFLWLDDFVLNIGTEIVLQISQSEVISIVVFSRGWLGNIVDRTSKQRDITPSVTYSFLEA